MANVNAAIFVAGYAALVAGVALASSGPTAAIVGGSILMVIAAWPYVRPTRKG